MRLSRDQARTIVTATRELASPGASVRLFGSRLRDDVRGGDIDLMSYVMVTGAYAVFLDALAYRPELLGTDALRDELHTLVVRYLEP